MHDRTGLLGAGCERPCLFPGLTTSRLGQALMAAVGGRALKFSLGGHRPHWELRDIVGAGLLPETGLVPVFADFPWSQSAKTCQKGYDGPLILAVASINSETAWMMRLFQNGAYFWESLGSKARIYIYIYI